VPPEHRDVPATIHEIDDAQRASEHEVMREIQQVMSWRPARSRLPGDEQDDGPEEDDRQGPP
jgi:hypothetical protein